MPRAALTDLTIRSLKPPSQGQAIYWDQALRCFGIRVSVGGSKSWVVYKDKRLVTLSRYPSTSLKEARQQARETLAGPTKPKNGMTVAEALTTYYDTFQGRKRTIYDYRRTLDKHLKAKLGSRPLSKVLTDDLLQIIDSLEATPAEQRHFHNYVVTFLRFCVRRRLLAASPLAGISNHKKGATRDRVLNDKELGAVLKEALTPNYPFHDILLLCIYLGQRRGELGKVRWEYIDRSARTITLPAEITKNGITHTFPYPQSVQDIFDRLPTREGTLFPGRTSKNEFWWGWSRAKENFDTRVPLPQWQIHDLRRTFATNMHRLGVPQICVERLLNHVSGGVQSPISRVYNRWTFMPEMKDALDRHQGFIHSLLQ